MTEPVALEAILPCLRGAIPSPFATCAPDGTPNVTYMSIVQYVDTDRVALSRQFFNKSRSNLDANPKSQVRVVDPETLREYALDLEYLHTETHGPIFDAMNANNEAIASQAGMENVFRLRGVDIHRVVRCVAIAGTGSVASVQPERQILRQLDELTRRLTLAVDLEEASRVALESLDDLFGFRRSILLVRDAQRLFAVADNGYSTPAAGAEVAFGTGVIGIAAERRHVVCVSNLARSRVMLSAMREHGAVEEVPLPGLDDAQSVAAIPLVVQDEVTGVLYLESAEPGVFGPHNERLLRIVGGLVAGALRALGAETGDQTGPDAPAASPSGTPLEVTYYQADDSVFVGDDYIVKGVPGRILWKLLNEFSRDGRATFTNRELRLDERLGLPPGNDNLEARLLVLRKRLAGADHGIALERTGRGRLELRVASPLHLMEVPTRGPMRAAHAE